MPKVDQKAKRGGTSKVDADLTIVQKSIEELALEQIKEKKKSKKQQKQEEEELKRLAKQRARQVIEIVMNCCYLNQSSIISHFCFNRRNSKL